MIYLIINYKFYNIIIEYALSINKKIPNSKIIIFPKEMVKINNDNTYIFFGMYYINYPIYNLSNVYYINLEQLTIDGTNSKLNILNSVINFSKNNPNCNILDYSQANVTILKNNNIKSKYLPYQVNYDEIFNYTKEYNFATCSTFNARVNTIYNKIAKNFDRCMYIGRPPKWGNERDKILFRVKVLANIHYKEKDYNILEEIRITRCILNKIIVVSEYSFEYEKYPLYQYIIFSEYDKIEDKVVEVLNNYEYYYNKIYNKINIDNINNILKNYIDFF